MIKGLVLLNYIILVFLAVGCDDPRVGEESVFDYGTGGEIARLDVSGSCVNSCGDFSPQGCWCDEICEFYEDCCKDISKTCSRSATRTASKKAIPPDSNACSGYCNEKAPAGCWCDALCERIGDCCPDVKGQCNQ